MFSELEYDGFKFSKKSYWKATDTSPLFAIDCEMVITSDHRMSLAYICVVNEQLETVYKSLVKPDKPIIDYLSK